jgi:hypothetical protein
MGTPIKPAEYSRGRARTLKSYQPKTHGAGTLGTGRETEGSNGVGVGVLGAAVGVCLGVGVGVRRGVGAGVGAWVAAGA